MSDPTPFRAAWEAIADHTGEYEKIVAALRERRPALTPSTPEERAEDRAYLAGLRDALLLMRATQEGTNPRLNRPIPAHTTLLETITRKDEK